MTGLPLQKMGKHLTETDVRTSHEASNLIKLFLLATVIKNIDLQRSSSWMHKTVNFSNSPPEKTKSGKDGFAPHSDKIFPGEPYQPGSGNRSVMEARPFLSWMWRNEFLYFIFHCQGAGEWCRVFTIGNNFKYYNRVVAAYSFCGISVGHKYISIQQTLAFIDSRFDCAVHIPPCNLEGSMNKAEG